MMSNPRTRLKSRELSGVASFNLLLSLLLLVILGGKLSQSFNLIFMRQSGLAKFLLNNLHRFSLGGNENEIFD